MNHQKFTAPPGLDSLGTQVFGGLTREELIRGSVRTWIQNGKKNGGGSVDITNNATIDSLYEGDVTVPGYIRLPVCSPERALQSWETSDKGSSANYPCDILPGRLLNLRSTLSKVRESPAGSFGSRGTILS